MTLRLGILGAGMIATIEDGYLPGLRKLGDRVAVTAIASRTRAKAEAVAAEWEIPAVHDDLTGMLAAGDVDAVINLTPIDAHYATSREVLEAGKHLITEKPLAGTLEEATALIDLADAKGLQILCAPVDLLRREWSETRRLVREGTIGKVAFARMQSSHGGPANQSWPADPTWFYQRGAGPLRDMGVYGIDRVVGVLGPARRVSAMSGVTTPVRHARGGPHDGLAIEVTEDDNTLLLLDFGDATFATVDATFNVLASKAPAMELYGLDGTLLVHKPDDTGQLPLELFRADAVPGVSGWVTPRSITDRPEPDPAAELQRAVLAAHLADVLDGAPNQLGPDRARHVLEIMLAAMRSAREGVTVTLETTFAR